jgi:long-subunit acyl-CoA synthetase (AMP-forming)
MTVRAFGARVNDSFVEDARRQLENCEGGIFSQPPQDVKAVSMLIFTSGTTSQPRAVQQTLEALEICCAVWSERLDMKAGDRSLMVLPLHHVFGICTVYLMLLNGVAVGVCPDFRRLYDAVERFRADFLFLVPALADILAGKIESRAGSAEKSLGFR